MLTTSLNLAPKYDYLAEKFQKAYAFLRRDDLAQLETGSHPIDGEDVVANVQRYTTMPKEQARFESHDRFFDIQFMVEGEELFGYVPRDRVSSEPYDAQNDMTFHAEPENPLAASYILLKKGDLAIVPPEDAHKPRCAAGEPKPVVKIVVKVRV